MKTRIITGLVMAAIGIPVLVFSDYIVYPIVLSILAVIAVWELLGLTGFRKNIAVFLPSYVIAALLPIHCFSVKTLAEAMDVIVMVATYFLAFMLYLIGYCVVKRGKIKLGDVCLHYVFFLYVTMAFASLSLLRYIPNGVYY